MIEIFDRNAAFLCSYMLVWCTGIAKGMGSNSAAELNGFSD